jgi:hypothetical protein
MLQRGGRRRDARRAAQHAQLEVPRPTDDLSGNRVVRDPFGFLVFRLTTFLRVSAETLSA